MLYMVTFTINIPQMLAYIPYMDPMGNDWKNQPKSFTRSATISASYRCHFLVEMSGLVGRPAAGCHDVYGAGRGGVRGFQWW